MRFSFSPVILCFLLLSNILYAEVYKWVDEDGKVHFSDKPKSKNAKKFIYDPKVIGQENFENNKSSKIKKNQPQSTELEIKRQKEFETYNRTQTEKQIRYCREARDDLKATQNSQLLYNYDKNGKRYFLDEKQRKETIEKKEKIVKKWCSK